MVRTVDLMATGAPKERAMTRVRSGQTAYKAVERAGLRVANNNKGGTGAAGLTLHAHKNADELFHDAGDSRDGALPSFGSE